MTNFIKLLATIAILATGLACEKKSSGDDSGSQSTFTSYADDASDILPAPGEDAIASTGKTVKTSFVLGSQSAVGITPAGDESMTWEEMMIAFPTLAERVIFLGKINKVIETDAGTVDLYVDNKIVMTLRYSEEGDSLILMNTTYSEFSADLITFETLAPDNRPIAALETIDFMMSTCLPAQPLPEKQFNPVNESNTKCAAIVTSMRLRELVEAPEPKEAVEPPTPVPVPGPIVPKS